MLIYIISFSVPFPTVTKRLMTLASFFNSLLFFLPEGVKASCSDKVGEKEANSTGVSDGSERNKQEAQWL